MIRRVLLTAAAVMLVAQAVHAQRPAIDVIVHAEYLWTSKVSAVLPDGAGDFDIKSNPAYGVTGDIEIRPGTELELMYLAQPSKVTFKRGGGGPTEELFDLTTHYIHIGAMQGIQRGNIRPFTGATLGATAFSADGGDTEWKFSVGFNAGAKIYINERIGIKLNGRILASMIDTNAGLWFGTGGPSVSIGGSAVWQWDLGGGLVIRL